MSRNPIRAISLVDFVELVSQAGLPLEVEDFEELIERGLLVPLSTDEPRFCSLQLFGLARYAEAVRAYRHPWLEPEPSAPLDEVTELAASISALADRLRGASDVAPSRDEIDALVTAIERHLQARNPFGRLGEFLDLLRQDVVEELRGEARLWVELHLGARALADLATHYGEGAEPAGDLRTTQDMAAVDASALSADPSRLRTTQDMEVVSSPSRSAERTRPSLTAPRAAVAQDGSVRVTAEMEVVDRREGAAGDEEGANPFKRDRSQSTSNSQDLQQRLEALRALDGRRARASSIAAKAIALSAPKPSEAEGEAEEEEAPAEAQAVEVAPPDAEAPAGEVSSAPAGAGEENFFAEEGRTVVLDDRPEPEPEASEAEEPPADDAQPAELTAEEIEVPVDLAERIRELNLKRETYMREQNWTGLVALYEEGIDLFEGNERQQVLLTLAKLYELKLERSEQAFDNLSRAFSLGGGAKVLSKILEAMRRLGDERFTPWVEARLDDDELPDEARVAVQRHRAMRMREEGNPERAFLTYASYLADNPASRMSERALELLHELVEGIDEGELWAFYDDIIEQSEDDDWAAHIAHGAGMCALERGDTAAAIRYLERALEVAPGNETYFLILTQLYDEGRRFAEAYAFLTRYLERVSEVEHQVRVLCELAEIAVKHLYAPEEAAIHYERALELGGARREVFEALVRVQLEASQWADAIASIDELTGGAFELSNEERVQWWLMGAQAAQRGGKPQQHRRLMEQVLHVEPGNEAAQRALGMIS